MPEVWLLGVVRRSFGSDASRFSQSSSGCGNGGLHQLLSALWRWPSAHVREGWRPDCPDTATEKSMVAYLEIEDELPGIPHEWAAAIGDSMGVFEEDS